MRAKWFQIFFVLMVGFVPLYAGIEQYFKKAEGKSDLNKIKNIDFIYCINLDQRPEKFASCTKQLHSYGVHPYRFSAVNGWELTLQAVNDLGVNLQPGMNTGQWGTQYPIDGHGEATHEIVHRIGQTYFCHCMSRGAIGIVLSHLSILQDAYDSGYETIWVMEDDIQIIQDPRLLSTMVEKLDALVSKEKWDILFTDRDTKNGKGEYVPCTGHAWRPNFQPPHPEVFQQRRNIGRDFSRVGARYGAYSMIVRRSGMKKILDFIRAHRIFLPYDMDFYLPPKINMFAVREDIISTQVDAISDNGGPNYRLKDPRD